MRKGLLLAVLVFISTACFIIALLKPAIKVEQLQNTTAITKKISKKDRIDLAIQQEFDMTKDPALGYVPRHRLVSAL